MVAEGQGYAQITALLCQAYEVESFEYIIISMAIVLSRDLFSKYLS